jgi:lysyl-tRNA synthetase class 2
VCNGFGELVDPTEQRRRLVGDQEERAARGLPVYPIDERFLDALGRVPPSGGNALGLDRLIALSCGTKEISSVIAFTTDEL